MRPVIARSACGHRPRGKIPWVAILNVRLYCCLVVFGHFYYNFICNNFQCGGQVLWYIYPTVGSSRYYMYFCIFVSLYGHLCRFLTIKSCDLWLRAVPAASGHGFKSPEWQYNIFIRLSVRLSAGLITISVFVIISILRIRHCAMHLSLHLGTKDPVGSNWAYMSVRPFICLYIWSSVSFLAIICAGHYCAQCMQMQPMGSNILSGSIIYRSVCPSVRMSVRFFTGLFVIFVFVSIFSVGYQNCNVFVGFCFIYIEYIVRNKCRTNNFVRTL